MDMYTQEKTKCVQRGPYSAVWGTHWGRDVPPGDGGDAYCTDDSLPPSTAGNSEDVQRMGPHIPWDIMTLLKWRGRSKSAPEW